MNLPPPPELKSNGTLLVADVPPVVVPGAAAAPVSVGPMALPKSTNAEPVKLAVVSLLFCPVGW